MNTKFALFASFQLLNIAVPLKPGRFPLEGTPAALKQTMVTSEC